MQISEDRHKIDCRSIHGESGEADVIAMRDWIEDNMTNVLNGYALSDTCNPDETGLFCKTLSYCLRQ